MTNLTKAFIIINYSEYVIEGLQLQQLLELLKLITVVCCIIFSFIRCFFVKLDCVQLDPHTNTSPHPSIDNSGLHLKPAEHFPRGDGLKTRVLVW